MCKQMTLYGWLFTACFCASASEPTDVYRITAEDCITPVDVHVQTGFAVSGRKGIVTALHGVIGCNDLSAVSEKRVLTNLNLDEVDVTRDLAVIGLHSVPRNEGLRSGSVPTHSGSARVLGHPHAISGLHEMTLEIPTPPTRPLHETVPGELFHILRTRNSPDPSVRIVSINGDLQPGHSGAPILDVNGSVIGVASGGIGHGEYGIAWAIPLQDAKWRSVRDERSSIDDLVRHASDGLFWSPGNAGASKQYPRRVSLWRYADGRVSGVFADPLHNVAYVNTFEKIRIFNFDDDNTADIEVGKLIQGMSLSPNARTAYVIDSRPRMALKLVDLRGRRVSRHIDMPQKKACPPVITPSGELLLVPMPNDGEIWVYNTRSKLTHTAKIDGTSPCSMTVSRRTDKVYIGTGRNEVRAFKLGDFYRKSGTIKSQAVFLVGQSPRGLVEDATGSYLYVTNMRSDTISVIDLPRGDVTETIKVGKGPWGIAITPDSRWIYVANRGDATVSVIDTARNDVIENLMVDQDPTDIVLSHRGDRVYVGHFYQNSVTLIE